MAWVSSLPLMIGVLAVAPKDKIGLYITIGGACIALGPAFGPVLSVLMSIVYGWRGIFALPLVGATVLALAGLRVMNAASETAPSRLDAPSLRSWLWVSTWLPRHSVQFGGRFQLWRTRATRIGST